MIAEIQSIKRVCNGDFTKVANYKEAISDNCHMWHLHHKLGLNHTVRELKDNNLYYHRPPEELEFLPSEYIGMIDTYDSIKGHYLAHADAKRRIDSEFEFTSFINELSRKQCKDNQIIDNKLRFESWIQSVIEYEQIKNRLDIDGLNVHTGLSRKFLEELLDET